MWQKLKLEKLNIATNTISEPSLTIVIETHSKIDTATIEVDNQMAVIQI
jgi:hypothetical protein